MGVVFLAYLGVWVLGNGLSALSSHSGTSWVMVCSKTVRSPREVAHQRSRQQEALDRVLGGAW